MISPLRGCSAGSVAATLLQTLMGNESVMSRISLCQSVGNPSM